MRIFNDNDAFSNILFILALVVAFNIPVVGPFAGILLILKKVGVLGRRTTAKNIGSNSQRSARMEKYKIMTEGRNVESIEYLASAVGVSYQAALGDLQQMVAQGQFGPGAYINYVDKTLVINGAAGAAQSASGGKPEKDAAGKPKSKKKKSKSKSSQQSGEGLTKALLIVGIALIALGALQLSEPIDWLIWLGVDAQTIAEMVPGLFMVAGGVLSLVFRSSLKKRAVRFKVYEAACLGRDYISLEELASKAGVSVKKARRDIEAMLEKKLLTKSAYVDQGAGILILDPSAKPEREEPQEPEDDDGEDRYKAIIREIRALNDAIPDEMVSEKIDEMEDLTSKIFAAVQEKPEKLPQIKSFMSYYLPTTLKLLRSYAQFEASGADGENVRSAKAEIESILDTLVDGFRKQLDKLYAADVIDISSDIDVLETMLRRDGLAGDGSEFSGSGSSGKGFKRK